MITIYTILKIIYIFEIQIISILLTSLSNEYYLNLKHQIITFWIYIYIYVCVCVCVNSRLGKNVHTVDVKLGHHRRDIFGAEIRFWSYSQNMKQCPRVVLVVVVQFVPLVYEFCLIYHAISLNCIDVKTGIQK